MSTYVMAFESTHAAMASEAAFQVASLPSQMIPMPRAISAGCGMSLRFEAENDAAARDAAAVCADARGLATLYEELSKEEYRQVAKI